MSHVYITGRFEQRLQKLAKALCLSDERKQPLCIVWQLSPSFPQRLDALLDIASFPYGTSVEYKPNDTTIFEPLECNDRNKWIPYLQRIKPSFFLTIMLETRYRFLDINIRIGVHLQDTDTVKSFVDKLQAQPPETYCLLVASNAFLCEELVQVLAGRCSFVNKDDPSAFFVLASCPRLLSSSSSSLCKLVSEYADSEWEQVD